MASASVCVLALDLSFDESGDVSLLEGIGGGAGP